MCVCVAVKMMSTVKLIRLHTMGTMDRDRKEWEREREEWYSEQLNGHGACPFDYAHVIVFGYIHYTSSRCLLLSESYHSNLVLQHIHTMIALLLYGFNKCVVQATHRTHTFIVMRRVCVCSDNIWDDFIVSCNNIKCVWARCTLLTHSLNRSIHRLLTLVLILKLI